MSDSIVHNLLVGSHDLSTALWFGKAKRSDKTFWGAAVADCDTGGGIYFPNDANMADARVTSGAEYVLSFFARADVAGDRIHSDVWGSKYMLDTELTTEWQQVVMPYGIVNADHREIFIYGLGTNSGTVYMALPMCVRGTEPAAWAPAEGETLAGGGALMSANLWNTSTENFKPDANGVYLVGKSAGELYCTITGASAFTENQTIHMGASLRGAGKGCLKPYVAYTNAAGNWNWVGFPDWTPGAEWQRFEATCVVPSGMTPRHFGFNKSAATGDMEVTNPVFSYGSPVVLAISSSTLAWSAGILATVRYYQLAAPTAATPTVPTSSSSLGSWTETEPTADVTKVLWTCERTVYADGTESWSKASKSTSYEAAKDAQSTATDAQNKAQEAQEQVLDVSARLNTNTEDITATIDSKVALVQQDVDSNAADVKDLNSRLSDEIRTRQSFMRFSEESSDPTLTLGQTDSPAQVKLTNKQLQFLYLNTVVAYMSGDALLINNAKILQQLQLGGFAFVPRDNGNLAFKWVGGDS